MPNLANLSLNNGTAARTYSVSMSRGTNHDAAFRDLTVTPANCQPAVTVAYTMTDTRRTVREKVSHPVIGVDASSRSVKVGLVEVDIQLRADLVATEAEIAAALNVAMNSLLPTNPVLGPVWYKGETLY